MKKTVFVFLFVLSAVVGAAVLKNGSIELEKEEVEACKTPQGCTVVSNEMLSQVHALLMKQEAFIRELQSKQNKTCI